MFFCGDRSKRGWLLSSTLLFITYLDFAVADPSEYVVGDPATPVVAVFALPRDVVQFQTRQTLGALQTNLGHLEQVADRTWHWTAPDTAGAFGEVQVFTAGSTGLIQRINLFVLVPAQEADDGYVGEFRVDSYPTEAPAKAAENYAPPVGFVKVTAENAERRVSSHFRIGQFISKQAGDWPKYVVPGPQLYSKLESLLELVRARGHDADTLHVMSGFRTPFYNRSLGNVQFSRHIYGDAADVFVDVDGDGNMDDLNGDGLVSVEDAATLGSWMNSLADQAAHVDLAGGLGVYDATRYHGPFVHIDTRGYRARWGHLPD